MFGSTKKTKERTPSGINKRIGQLMVLGSLGLLLYAASKDPGIQMMAGSVISVPQLINQKIMDAQDRRERLQMAQAIPESWRIKFDTVPPAGPDKTLIAFVDPMCSNCRMLIANTAAINKAGYAIDYIISPLSGDDRVLAADAITCAPEIKQPEILFAVAGDKPWEKVAGCSNTEHYAVIETFLARWGVKVRPYIVTPKGVGISGNLNTETLLGVLAN